MKITINKAHKLTGIPESTLYRHARKGRFSVSQNENGEKVVDTAELYRAYPETKPKPPSEKGDNHKSEALIKVENAPVLNNTEIIMLLRSQVRTLENQLQIANREKASLLKIVDTQTLALPKPAEPEPKRKWWEALGFKRQPTMIL